MCHLLCTVFLVSVSIKASASIVISTPLLTASITDYGDGGRGRGGEGVYEHVLVDDHIIAHTNISIYLYVCFQTVLLVDPTTRDGTASLTSSKKGAAMRQRVQTHKYTFDWAFDERSSQSEVRALSFAIWREYYYFFFIGAKKRDELIVLQRVGFFFRSPVPMSQKIVNIYL